MGITEVLVEHITQLIPAPGMLLKRRWEVIHKYGGIADIIVVVLLMAADIWFVRVHLKGFSKKS